MRISRLWMSSLIAGLAAALVIFDASVGINWTAWTIIAIAGLLRFRRPDATLRRSLFLPLGFAFVLAGGFAVTTSGPLVATNTLLIASLLALAVVLGHEPARAASYGAVVILSAPIRGLTYTLRGTYAGIVQWARTTRIATMSPALRGSLIALPVVVVLALLFAAADPVFASGRDAIYNIFGDWSMAPRVIFGFAVTLFVAGALTGALPCIPTQAAVANARVTRVDRHVERLTVVAAAASVCWLFVVLQIGYLFLGSPGATVGSRITFAQYAHRGFGELSLAATIAAVVIAAAHSDQLFRPLHSSARGPLAFASLMLLAAVSCILASAFHRITLYEDAYGFSVQRVYAQAYILLTLAVLLVLAWQVLHAFDVRAAARHVMAVALATFCFLLYWNCDAWIVRANLDRFATTGRLDVDYLTWGLSPDAYPALIRALPQMSQADRASTVAALDSTAVWARPTRPPRWYEWNLRRNRASDVLKCLRAR